jgi:hypothetical protein
MRSRVAQRADITDPSAMKMTKIFSKIAAGVIVDGVADAVAGVMAADAMNL